MIDIDNRVFSGASYSVLEMQTSNRMDRKSLSFELSPAPSNIPASIMNTRDNFVNPFSLGIDHPPVLEKKESDSPDDSDYSKLVTTVETRISDLVGAGSSATEMTTSDDSPASLEELLKQLQTDE